MKKKRLLSSFLAICMAVGLFPLSAFASEPKQQSAPPVESSETWFMDQLADGSQARAFYSAFVMLAERPDFTADTASVSLLDEGSVVIMRRLLSGARTMVSSPESGMDTSPPTAQ